MHLRKLRPVRKAVARVLRLTPATADRPAVLRITVGKETSEYRLVEFRTDFPGERAFRFEKINAPTFTEYHVRYMGRGQAGCECMGHLHYGACRHSDALVKVVESGLLPAIFPAVPVEPEPVFDPFGPM